jgi:hypothetical protein
MTIHVRDQIGRHSFGGARPEKTRTAQTLATAGAQAIAALAYGALAIGALAIGAVAIGRLAIGRARVRRVEIDELVVRRLRVSEDLQTPSKDSRHLGST